MSNEINPVMPFPPRAIPQQQQLQPVPPAGTDLTQFGLVVGLVGGVVLGGLCIFAGAYHGDSETTIAGVLLLGATHYFGKQTRLI